MADEEKAKEKPKVDGSITVTLRKSIIANGDETKELTFREPTAADIERTGNPVNVDMLSGDVPKLTFDAKAMTQMMSLLAAVPPSSIRQMNTRDWNSAAWQLAAFFMPDL